MKFTEREKWLTFGEGLWKKNQSSTGDKFYFKRHTLSGPAAPHTHPNDIKSTNYNKWLSFSELHHQSGNCAELIKETYLDSSETKSEKAKQIPRSMQSFPRPFSLETSEHLYWLRSLKGFYKKCCKTGPRAPTIYAK